MKEKLKNKKVVYTIIGIISVLLVAAAVTYAYWLVTRTQQGENVISSACLDIDLAGSGDITLQEQFPISDEDGMKLTPYEFTVTNNCNASVDYQIALEAIESGDEISSSALKVALNDNVNLFSSYNEVDTTLSNAYEARRLGMGTLANKNSEETYSLRIWIDQDASIEEMNKTFKSKITVTVGQGIINDRDTLANKMLASYGGKEAIQEFSEERTFLTRTEEDQMDMVADDSDIWFGTSYEFDSDHENFYLTGDLVQATLKECREGTKNCGNYTLLIDKEDETSETLYEVLDYYDDNESFKANVTEYDYPPFIPGVYKAQDDLGDSYYFKGNITNNYVKFGSWKEKTKILDAYATKNADGSDFNGWYDTYESCEENSGDDICFHGVTAEAGTDMYWKIVRINGDGTIRLLYDGIFLENGEYKKSGIGISVYNYGDDNDYYNVSDFVYERDGVQTDSVIKTKLDSWYTSNLKSNYNDYIADTIFCNQNGYTSSNFMCSNKNDRYTVSNTTIGNGLLSNPVGLLTADEVVMGTNQRELGNEYSVTSYWTMTGDSSYSYYIYFENKELSYKSHEDVEKDDWEFRVAARPVINIKADVLFSGAGTLENPYVIAE